MKHSYRRLYEEDAQQPQQAQQQPQQAQQQPQQQPQQAQQQPQQPQQAQQPTTISVQDVDNFRSNIAKQVTDTLNKALQAEMNGSSNIANLVKTNANAKKYVDAILAKNDNFSEKMEMMKKFFDTLAQGQQAQPVQQPQPAQQAQTVQQPQPAQPAQQNESFLSKYQRKLYENYQTNKMMR